MFASKRELSIMCDPCPICDTPGIFKWPSSWKGPSVMEVLSRRAITRLGSAHARNDRGCRQIEVATATELPWCTLKTNRVWVKIKNTGAKFIEPAIYIAIYHNCSYSTHCLNQEKNVLHRADNEVRETPTQAVRIFQPDIALIWLFSGMSLGVLPFLKCRGTPRDPG